MKNLGLKQKALEDLMNFMSEKDGEMLKKHPKITAVKIDTVQAMPKKEMEKEMPEMDSEEPMDSEEEMSPEEMKQDNPDEDLGEGESSKLEALEKALGFDISEKLSPLEIKKLLSMI